MKTFTYCIALVMWALALTLSHAQETGENDYLDYLKEKKEAAINKEKEGLKEEIETINAQVDNEEISFAEAEELKKAAAEKHALNIENKLVIIDNQIALMERNGSVDDDTDIHLVLFKDGEIASLEVNGQKTGADYKRKYDRRTESQMVFSFGLNNTIIEGQTLDDSPYKIGGSRYAELGLVWSTRVFKESNWLRFKYGFSFQFNGLKPEDNRYFVDTGSETILQEFPTKLDKSKFRMDNLVIPIHFEFGPSKKKVHDDYFRYSTHNQFKIGLGGYAGLNLGTRQKLRFDDANEEVKQKLKANYNTNNFVYGVSGYIGFSDISIYAKYDLNTLFKDNPVEQRNVSLGLRWDWD